MMNKLPGRLAIALFLALLTITLLFGRPPQSTQSNRPIYIAFLWHMHQPIYWPYESIVQTELNSRYPYSLFDIFNQRVGPYTTWPGSAVQLGIGAGFQHFGAQISFSGSLIENLNNLETYGNSNFQNWKSTWNTVKNLKTTLGNPRLDMVGFGYHHPLMGLIDYDDTRRQIEAHKQMMASNFTGNYSKGIFPPENAFSPREIPALVDEGFQWVLVDNIHFDRACQGYPFSTSGNLYEPNKADIRNPNPNDWLQLTGLWAPTEVSARWGREPHYVQYIDPSTGTSKKIIAVPADRYMGNEDGRGGFGALNYDGVMSQLESYNTDSLHPILIVLHHDGDNYGGGSDAYYNSNFQNFVAWLQANPTRFVCTTIQDYLDMYPPDTNDVIHVEDGSWSGADNGDPEFLKWNGDPVNGYSPDRNSWGIVTAAKNIVETAQQINPSDPNTQNAWKYFLNSESSDYWYWDGTQNGIWDSHPARACNQAVQYAKLVTGSGPDLTPPTIYVPQREPYNPGGTEWGINQSNNFTVWTYAYDLSGLKSVTLKYRTSTNSIVSSSNETYTGGAGVAAWTSEPMSGTWITPQTNPLPTYKALEYSASISGYTNILLDYYVEAVDSNNNIGRSAIRHVWVGANTGGGGTTGVTWSPVSPTIGDSITILVHGATKSASLHWGVNNTGSSWAQPNAVYWPAGSSLFSGTGPAVESPMSGPDTGGTLRITLPPFNNAAQSVQRVAFDAHYSDNTWDNNSGQDYHITIGGSPAPSAFIMDGSVDSSAMLVSSNGGINLYIGWNGADLYVATQSASSESGDMFVLISDSLGSQVSAPWAKTGTAMAWNAFLGNESTNNWSGWFNSTQGSITGSATSVAGTFLEGTITLQSLFGFIPSKLYLAVAKYQSPDGGTLLSQVPSGNGNGNVESTEYFTYTFTLPPGLPVLLNPPNNSLNQPLSTLLRWHRVANAISYHAQCATDSTFGSGLIIDDSTLTDTVRAVSALSNITTYFWRVKSIDTATQGSYSSFWRFTTIAPVPSTPLTLSPVDGSIEQPTNLLFRWSSTKYASAYRLQISTDSLFSATVLDDSVLTDTVHQVTGLDRNTLYYWRVLASDAAGSGGWSAVARYTTLNTSMFTFSVLPNWNLFSVPLGVSSPYLMALFPTVTTHAFSYDGSGYILRDTLLNSVGYWMKFAAGQQLSIAGTPRSADTITVQQGWNLIGGLSDTIPAGSVLSVPPSTITSSFFGYLNRYYVSDSLLPGFGYWVKMDTAGELVLTSQHTVPVTTARVDELGGLGKISIRDSAGNEEVLRFGSRTAGKSYFLPPIPPAGGFDVRFATSTSVEALGDEMSREIPIRISSSSYPLKVLWEGGSNDIAAVLNVDGRRISLESHGTLVIPDSSARLFLELGRTTTVPKAFSLEQNYPNPFNPGTSIRYNLPVESRVRLMVYDVLGRLVATLADGIEAAGERQIVWDGSAISSGLYYYRIDATNLSNPSQSYSEVRKMVLMK